MYPKQNAKFVSFTVLLIMKAEKKDFLSNICADICSIVVFFTINIVAGK